MTNLPTLPGCGQPATILIEIYSAANGALHGSLDGSVYACEQHAADTISAIEAAGFTAYRMPGGDAKRCGDGMDFTGPTARPFTAPTTPEPTAAPEMQHPRWCDRKNCADRQEHRSPQLSANPTGRELVGIFVTLVQLTIVDAPATVEILFAESRTEEVVQVVDVAQGIALAYRLRRVADWAAGRRS